jgi:hypothetical protein
VNNPARFGLYWMKLLNIATSAGQDTALFAYAPSRDTTKLFYDVEYDFDFGDLSTMYTTESLATPVANNGDSVGVVVDKTVRNFGQTSYRMASAVRHVTITGTSGTGNVTINGTNYAVTFATNLLTTVLNFISTHGATITTNHNLVVRSINKAGDTGAVPAAANRGVLMFYPSVIGGALSVPSFTNTTGDLAGSVTDPEKPTFITNVINSVDDAASWDGVYNNMVLQVATQESGGKWALMHLLKNNNDFNIHYLTSDGTGSQRHLRTHDDYDVGGTPPSPYDVIHGPSAGGFAITHPYGTGADFRFVLYVRNGPVCTIYNQEKLKNVATGQTITGIWNRMGHEEIPQLPQSNQLLAYVRSLRRFNGTPPESVIYDIIDEQRALLGLSPIPDPA